MVWSLQNIIYMNPVALNHNQNSDSKKLGTLEMGFAMVAVLAYFLCLGAAVALADADRDPAAINKASDLRPENFNGQYLAKNIRPAADEESLNQQIFEKPVANDMTAKFSALQKDYEMRERYQLNSYGEDLRYQQANKDLADWTIKSLMQFHLDHTVGPGIEKSAQNFAKNEKSGPAVQAVQAVATVVKVRKALKDTTMDIAPNMKTRFRLDIPGGTMSLGVMNPLVNASMDYHTHYVDTGVGSVKQPEKINLGLSREFSLIGAKTEANYGVMSSTVNYGVSKQLVGPLSAQVDQAHSLRDNSKDETLVRLNFGTSF